MIWIDYLDLACVLGASGLAWFKWGPVVGAFVGLCLVAVIRSAR